MSNIKHSNESPLERLDEKPLISASTKEETSKNTKAYNRKLTFKEDVKKKLFYEGLAVSQEEYIITQEKLNTTSKKIQKTSKINKSITEVADSELKSSTELELSKDITLQQNKQTLVIRMINFFSDLSDAGNIDINQSENKTITQKVTSFFIRHSNNKYTGLIALSCLCFMFFPILIYRCLADCAKSICAKNMTLIEPLEECDDENIGRLIFDLTNAVNNKNVNDIIDAVNQYIFNTIDIKSLEYNRKYRGVPGLSSKERLLDSLYKLSQDFNGQWEDLKKKNIGKSLNKTDNFLPIELFNRHMRLLPLDKLKECKDAIIKFKEALKLYADISPNSKLENIQDQMSIINNLYEEIDLAINSFNSKENTRGKKLQILLKEEKKRLKNENNYTRANIENIEASYEALSKVNNQNKPDS